MVPSFELEYLKEPGESTKSAAGKAAEAASATTGATRASTTALTRREGATDSLPVVFINNPKSLAAEAYRTIRTGILLSQAGEPPRTILVTSAQSGEGKTTSSVNLAASLASSGARVVIIDADLRRPSMSKHFQLDSSLPGLVRSLLARNCLKMSPSGMLLSESQLFQR